MRYSTKPVHFANSVMSTDTGIDLKTNLLSLGMLGLAMGILWILLFGF